MGQYQRLPHLLTQPVTNPKKAANALGWAVKEMERRYDVLSEVGYRDITGYNKAFARGKIEQPAGSGSRQPADLRAHAVHRRGRRRAQRSDDGRRARRRGVDHPHRPEGACGRHPPDRRHAASVGERDHRCDQGEHPGPHGVRRVEPHRLPGDPRPARRRQAGRQGRHAAAAGQLLGRQPHPGRVHQRGRGPPGRSPIGASRRPSRSTPTTSNQGDDRPDAPMPPGSPASSQSALVPPSFGDGPGGDSTSPPTPMRSRPARRTRTP